MKKWIVLFLALLQILLLVGCVGTQGGNALYADMPTAPQTNAQLRVYCLGNVGEASLILAALNRYQLLYPDVEVELIQPIEDSTDLTSANEYEQYNKLLTQIMAGEGPDIMLLDDYYIDVEKLVRQGIFADMEPFFQADGFDWEPYNQAVMDGGVWNGKRFTIPFNYTFDLLCTTREALEETNFDVEACKDFQGFLEETTRYMEDPTQTRRLFSYGSVPGHDFFYKPGISFVDYDGQTADLSQPLLTSAIQWYKTVRDTHPDISTYGLLMGASDIRDGQALWTTSAVGADLDLFYTAGALRTVGEAVMMPVRDVNGGIQARIEASVAVRGNSENLQNAYDFLKILLSPEIQNATQIGFSVLDAAAENYLTRRGKEASLTEGMDGFISTTRPGSAVDAPSQQEIQQVLALTREITGAYYEYQSTNVGALMWGYIDGMDGYEDFEEVMKDAAGMLKLYLTE